MILTHWSARPLGYIARCDPTEFLLGSPYDKPYGLWLSDETAEVSWKVWCEGNGFRPNGFAFRTDFEVDLTNVLWLKLKQELLDFTDEYASVVRTSWNGFEFTDYIINWERVGCEYHGILITPYIWECRLNEKTRWYNPWDCASGCFWNPKCLTKVSEKELN